MQSIQQELLSLGKERNSRQKLADDKSDINSPNYDPMIHITKIFNTPTALADIDQLIEKSNFHQKNIENNLNKKRKEYKESLIELRSDQGIDKLDSEVSKLLESFEQMKSHAEVTGRTINAMTANIKQLDHSKKNLTFTMTTLKRLQMLVTAYDRLEKQLESEKTFRNYKEIKHLLDAVLELNEYFQHFKSIDEVNKLNKIINQMKNQLIDDIFRDFDLEFKEDMENETLIDSCYILVALGDAYKEKLQTWYIKQVLKDITNIFCSSEEAGSLDNINRRFIYFQNILSNFELKHLKNFPKSWNMNLELTRNFCSYTKNDLKEVLKKEAAMNKAGADVNILLNSLSQTLDFEIFLNKKFKYYKDFDAQLVDSSSPDFTKTISEVFEPYLNLWIDHQGTIIEKKITEFTNPKIMFRRTGEGAADDNKHSDESLNVLESSAELFRLYRQILSQLSKLTNGKSLIKLSKIFSKYLIQYQHRILEAILPDSKTLISADLENKKEGISLICLVLNTSDYCSLTVTQLEEKIKSIIKPDDLATKIEFESVNNGFMQMISYCINLLFYEIENDIQLSWRELNGFNWKLLSDVTGESRYIESIKSIIRESCQLIFNQISRTIYIRNFIEKIVEMLLKNIIINIIKLEPITVIIAEQFKLDLQELKTFINILPTLTEGGEKILTSSSFKANINLKFRNIDTLMKILMVPTKPMDTFIDSYFTIIGDSNFSNFMKVLQLNGVLKTESSEKDKFKYMDMFKQQIKVFEQNSEPLIESNEYLENLNVASKTDTVVRKGHTKSNSRSIYLPSTISGSNSANGSSSSTNSPSLPSPPELPAAPDFSKDTTPNTSPKSNFGFFNNSIDSGVLANKRGNIESSLAKTFTENKTNFNENFKKFFKRGD